MIYLVLNDKKLKHYFHENPLVLEGNIDIRPRRNEILFQIEVPCIGRKEPENPLPNRFLKLLTDSLYHLATSKNKSLTSKSNKDNPSYSYYDLFDHHHKNKIPRIEKAYNEAFFEPIKKDSHVHCYEGVNSNTWNLFILSTSKPINKELSPREQLYEEYNSSPYKKNLKSPTNIKKINREMIRDNNSSLNKNIIKTIFITARFVSFRIPASFKKPGELGVSYLWVCLALEHIIQMILVNIGADINNHVYFRSLDKHLSNNREPSWSDVVKMFSKSGLIKELSTILPKDQMDNFRDILKKLIDEKYIKKDKILLPLKSLRAIRKYVNANPPGKVDILKSKRRCWLCGKTFEASRKDAHWCPKNCRTHADRARTLLSICKRESIPIHAPQGDKQAYYIDIPKDKLRLLPKFKNRQGTLTKTYGHLQQYLKTQSERGFPDKWIRENKIITQLDSEIGTSN